MTLSDSLLNKLCEEAQLVYPYKPENVGPCSVDLTLGGEVRPEGNGSRAFASTLDLHELGAFELHPGERVLATTAEVIRMPRDKVGFLMLRSTAARMGLEHSFSGLVDPLFEGQLTLELKNDLKTHSIVLTQGMRLVQMYVQSVEGAVQHGYDKVGFYQGQSGPTVSNYRVNSWYAARRDDTTKVA
ncbi:MAG: dCTP deaminase [Luteolibacter sp.]